MELLYPTRVSTHQFPTIVVSNHTAFSSHTVTHRKEETRNASFFFSSILDTQESDTQFKSSFDEYLKAMESVKSRRREGTRERKKDSKAESGVESSEFDDHVKALESIHTDKVERKEKEKKEQKNKGQIGRHKGDGLKYTLKKFEELEEKKGSEMDTGSGFRRIKVDKFQGGDLGKARETKEQKKGQIGSHKGDGLKYNLKKFEGLEEKKGCEMDKGSGFRRIKVDKHQREDLGSGDESKLIKTFPDRFDSDELVEDGVQGGKRISRIEMEERIQKLARSLNGADIDMPEWMFSKMMRSAQIRFCDHSIVRVIQILGKLGNWRRVLQVIEWLQMRERFKSHKLRYVYTAALDTLGKAKRPVEALNVFCTMQKQKCTYPDIVAYHCIAVTLGQVGHMKELFDVMDSMRSVPNNFKVSALEKMDPRLEPDIVVYNAVLNASVRRKQWEGAFWVLQQLKQAGLKPTSTTYGLVMEVMLACEKYNLVHEFFKKVQKSSIPTALTYRVVLNTLWQEGRTDEAIGIVQDMERRGIVGSASLYYDLARCLCSVGRCKEALEQVDKICKVASKPLVVTYTGLIQACLDAGRVEDGRFIFNHMHKYCSPNLITCNIMLNAFLKHGMLNEATELFQKTLESGKIRGRIKGKDEVTSDIYTFNTMMEALVEHKKWDDFEDAYKKMLHHGFHFITKRHLWMIMKASCAGKTGPIEMTWNHLMQEDRVPPPALVKERFRLKLENRDLMAALSTVTSHPCTDPRSFSKQAWLKLLQRCLPRIGNELIQHLLQDLESYLSSGESTSLVLSNLVESCKEIVRNDTNVAQTNCIEQLQVVHSDNLELVCSC